MTRHAFARLGAALDRFFAPVDGSRAGRVTGPEWARILKVAFASATLGFATMVASEYHDHPEVISRDPAVSALVVGLTSMVLSYLHRRQDGATIGQGGHDPRPTEQP